MHTFQSGLQHSGENHTLRAMGEPQVFTDTDGVAAGIQRTRPGASREAVALRRSLALNVSRRNMSIGLPEKLGNDLQVLESQFPTARFRVKRMSGTGGIQALSALALDSEVVTRL